MNPTDILKNEHRIIEMVLNVLEEVATIAAREQRLEEKDAGLVIDILQNFADRCHHGKEEDHLFVLMEAKGFQRENGPTGVMIREHEQSRTYIQNMIRAIPPASQGDAEAIRLFVEQAALYIALLRDHIQKEDECLFPMADRVLSEEEQQLLLKKFEKTEREDIGSGVHESYVQLVKTLIKKYQVDLGKLDENVFQCGCHHG